MEQTLEQELSAAIAHHKISIIEWYIYTDIMKHWEEDGGVKLPYAIQQGLAWDQARSLTRHYAANLSIEEFDRRYNIAWENMKEDFE